MKELSTALLAFHIPRFNLTRFLDLQRIVDCSETFVASREQQNVHKGLIFTLHYLLEPDQLTDPSLQTLFTKTTTIQQTMEAIC